MAKLQSRLSVAPPAAPSGRLQVNNRRRRSVANRQRSHGFLNSVLRVTFLYTRTRNFGGGCGLFHVILRREGNDAV